MQKAIILKGTMSKEYGAATISDAINSILEKNPGFRLINAIVLENKTSSCKLLCIFECG